MKNNKIRLALTTVVALTLLVCTVFAISASADGTNEKIPQVISQNICYQGDFAIMYAVDASTVEEGPVTLNVYTEFPGENAVPAFEYEVKTPSTIKIENDEGGFDEISVYEFKTNGISAKDMADIFYVQAVDSANNKSAVSGYSVAHYMYERLYGGYTLTEDQKSLYESCLVFGSNAQKVLSPDDANLVTDYKYLKVKDGYFASSNAYFDVFAPSAFATPVYTGAATNDAGDEFAGWTLTDLVTGAVSTIKDGESVIANANMSVVPRFGLTYLTFEKNSADNMPKKFTASQTITIENVERDGAAAGNKVLQYKVDTPRYTELYVTNTGADEVNANAYVFETYLNLDFADVHTKYSEGFSLGFINSSASKTFYVSPYIWYNGDSLMMSFQNFNNGEMNRFSLGVGESEWFKLRIELCHLGDYAQTPIIKVYVNDTLVNEGNFYKIAVPTDVSLDKLVIATSSSKNVYIMFDNTELMNKVSTED